MSAIDANVSACLTRQRAASGALLGNRFPVWTWADFREAVPAHLSLALRVLERRADAAGMRLHLLRNVSELGALLPDLPAEVAAGRVRSAAAVSDVARAGLLAAHGGLWVDADVLIATDLSFVLDGLCAAPSIPSQLRLFPQSPALPLPVPRRRHDGVTYTASPRDCAASFASNFFAARPCHQLWLGTWQEIKVPRSLTLLSPLSCTLPQPATRLGSPRAALNATSRPTAAATRARARRCLRARCASAGSARRCRTRSAGRSR